MSLHRQILVGDVLKKMPEIPDDSIDTIITSPPYWGLRNYGADGQIGLEDNFRDYLDSLRQVMNECKRVLKPTGSCWVNLDDTYISGGDPMRHKKPEPKYGHDKGGYYAEPNALEQGIKPKSVAGIPQRFFVQCIDDGWIARNHVIWAKPSAMPHPVKDRFVHKFESIFFFVKNEQYYFDLDSVRESAITEPHRRYGDEDGQATLTDTKHKLAKGDTKYANEDRAVVNFFDNKRRRNNALVHPKGKNPGDIMMVKQGQQCKDAHFATFPVGLPHRILTCACPKRVCARCDIPYVPKDDGACQCGCVITKPGIVLDPFFGSGTTGVAAEQLALNWVGIELNPEYVDIAHRRLAPYYIERLAA